MHRFFLSLLLSLAASAAPLAPLPLWPDLKPSGPPETDKTTAKDNLVAGRRVARIGDISVSTLTVYPAPNGKAAAGAVLVFPGGGYHILAWDLEGTEICEWLNSIGMAAVLVKYRVPAPAGTPGYVLPLKDAQRAMGIVRSRAAEWGIDPHRIGVLGFSAGAHLSAALSANSAGCAGCRPDFAILIYPGLLVPVERGKGDQLSPEVVPSANTPPTFLVQTEDDGVRVENSLVYYAALKAAKVPVEIHLYPTGGHGYGLRPSQHLVTTWPARAAEWMRSLRVAP